MPGQNGIERFGKKICRYWRLNVKTSKVIWRKFASLPGAVVGDTVGIASEQAIRGVLNVIAKYHPAKILELGAGIGTLTYTALSAVTHSSIDREAFRFFTIENNEFCLSQLAGNLEKYKGLYTVCRSTEELPQGMKFDFIIVDGGGDLDGDMGVMNFENRLEAKGVILVEGTRAFQRELIKRWYGSRKFVTVKLPSLSPMIVDPVSGIQAHNKAFHLFVFEPTWLQSYSLRIQSAFLSALSKAMHRFAK